MLEYLAMLAALVTIIAIVTNTGGIFTRGVSSGLNQAQDHLQQSLPQAVDDTHQGEVLEFDALYPPPVESEN